MAGRFVAATWFTDSSQGSATILERLDLRNGRSRELDIVYEDQTRSEQIRRFLVTSFGAVIWARYSNTGEIRKFDAGGLATLDYGDIVARSLRLNRTGHRAYWRNSDVPHSARLR